MVYLYLPLFLKRSRLIQSRDIKISQANRIQRTQQHGFIIFKHEIPVQLTEEKKAQTYPGIRGILKEYQLVRVSALVAFLLFFSLFSFE